MTIAALLLAPATGASGDVLGALGTDPDPGPHARVEWRPESPLVPGATVRTAVHFRIDEGWHTYGNTQNDTGFPARFEPLFPPGVELVGTAWPTPVRHVSPGDILDHVYEEETAVFLDLALSPDLPAGNIALGLKVDWLVCREACVFEGDSLSVEWKVLAGPPGTLPAPTETARFAARLPRPLSSEPGIRIAPVSTKESDEAAGTVGGRVRIDVAGAENLTFYPDLDGARLTHAIADGSKKGSRLELRLEAESGELAGVLEVRRRSQTVFIRIP